MVARVLVFGGRPQGRAKKGGRGQYQSDMEDAPGTLYSLPWRATRRVSACKCPLRPRRCSMCEADVGGRVLWTSTRDVRRTNTQAVGVAGERRAMAASVHGAESEGSFLRETRGRGGCSGRHHHVDVALVWAAPVRAGASSRYAPPTIMMTASSVPSRQDRNGTFTRLYRV